MSEKIAGAFRNLKLIFSAPYKRGSAPADTLIRRILFKFQVIPGATLENKERLIRSRVNQYVLNGPGEAGAFSSWH